MFWPDSLDMKLPSGVLAPLAEEETLGSISPLTSQYNSSKSSRSNSSNHESSMEDDEYPSCSAQTVGEYHYVENEHNLLGEGGYGAVYRGAHTRTGFQVALKKVPADRLKPGEVELMRSLNSDHLVNLIDSVSHIDFTYVVMELCERDLAQHLALYAPIEISEDCMDISSTTPQGALNGLQQHNLVTMLDNLARGYGVLFRERIVHRDIKPQNILLKYSSHSDEGIPRIAQAKITDFGISRCVQQGNESCEPLNNVAGTIYYMAPEVGANLLTSREYDFKVDMWSIGCVLYQCVTGEMPFDERRLCKMFLHVAGANYDAYKMPPLPKEAPRPIRVILTSLLAIEATKRLTPPEFYARAIMYASRVRNSSPHDTYDSVQDEFNANDENYYAFGVRGRRGTVNLAEIHAMNNNNNNVKNRSALRLNRTRTNQRSGPVNRPYLMRATSAQNSGENSPCESAEL